MKLHKQVPIGLHVDHDVPIRVSQELRNRQTPLSLLVYSVETARSLTMTKASDYAHLLHATQNQRILITCNWRDFQLLHGAWTHWTGAWGVTLQHTPILVVSQQVSAQRSAVLIDQFIQGGTPLPGMLYRYHPKTQWQSYS